MTNDPTPADRGYLPLPVIQHPDHGDGFSWTAGELLEIHAYARAYVDADRAMRAQETAVITACTRSHPHEEMSPECRIRTVIAEMRNMEARGSEATEIHLGVFAEVLERALADRAMRAQAAPAAAVPSEKELEQAIKERDEAKEFADAVLDAVLGIARAEWSSAYGRDDALDEINARMDALLALPQPLPCATCNDNGIIGGPSYSDPGEGGVPCPDCTTPTTRS